jgi:acetyl-CoA acetyltransferase
MAVASGLCRHVLCFRCVWEATHQALQRSGKLPGGGRRVSGEMQWQLPFGAASAANWIALYARRHFHEYGTTREQLAQIPLNGRRNARLNSDAIYREPLALDDYLSSRMLWERTDLKPADVDVAQLYDGFSFNALSWLERLGFCPMGEGGRFIEGGARIARDGELPLNTDGGQLSAGRLHGYGFLHEACTQLRGEGGQRQVPGDPEVALATSGGGIRDRASSSKKGVRITPGHTVRTCTPESSTSRESACGAPHIEEIHRDEIGEARRRT